MYLFGIDKTLLVSTHLNQRMYLILHNRELVRGTTPYCYDNSIHFPCFHHCSFIFFLVKSSLDFLLPISIQLEIRKSISTRILSPCGSITLPLAGYQFVTGYNPCTYGQFITSYDPCTSGSVHHPLISKNVHKAMKTSFILKVHQKNSFCIRTNFC